MFRTRGIPTMPRVASSLRERFIVEEAACFYIQTGSGSFSLLLFFSETALTAVAADELTSAGEAVDGQTAVVGTALAFCHGGRKVSAH